MVNPSLSAMKRGSNQDLEKGHRRNGMKVIDFESPAGVE